MTRAEYGLGVHDEDTHLRSGKRACDKLAKHRQHALAVKCGVTGARETSQEHYAVVQFAYAVLRSSEVGDKRFRARSALRLGVNVDHSAGRPWGKECGSALRAC